LWQQSLRIKKQSAQKALSLVRNMGILQNNKKIASEKDDVIIPLSRFPSENEMAILKSNIISLEFCTYEFKEREILKKNLFQILKNKLPPNALANLPRSYDVIGDIAILEIPNDLIEYRKIIGDSFKLLNPHYNTILVKDGPILDTFRVRNFIILNGGPSTITEHNEYGCKFRLDPLKVYFSPRLSSERQRIVSQIKKGEIIVDMFAGVGPFSIVIARTCDVKKIYGIDVNPYATTFMLQNIKINKCQHKITVILADSTKISYDYISADRVIMNLPEKSLDALQQACQFLKPQGGFIHLYLFTSKGTSIEAISEHIKSKIKLAGRKLVTLEAIRIVKEISPSEQELALELKVV
jgi:tRNA (guanine37-N1)-methyltransferase